MRRIEDLSKSELLSLIKQQLPKTRSSQLCDCIFCGDTSILDNKDIYAYICDSCSHIIVVNKNKAKVKKLAKILEKIILNKIKK